MDLKRKSRCIVFAALLCASAVDSPLSAQDSAADREFTFAARLLERGEHGLATEAFDQFIARFADDQRVADAHYYLAILARRRGEAEAAERHLELVLNPRHVTAAALHMLRGQVKLERGQSAEALAELEQVKADALPDDNSRATWRYLLGSAYRAAGNLAGAAEQFDAAAKVDTAVRASALVELGKVRADLKQQNEAIDALMEALAANPSPALAAEARALAADLSYTLRQYDRAAELYQQIVQQHQASPAFGPAVAGVLRSLFAAGQYQKVLEQYEATRSLAPREQTAEVLYLVGTSHVQLQQYAKASDYFLQFLRLTGGEHRLAGEVAYHYALCFYHLDLDAFEKWVASFEDDLPKMSRGPELQFLRAQAAISRNRPSQAVAYLAPLIKQPDGAHARQALAQRAALYEQLGQTAEASADYAEFARRFPDDPTALDAGRRAIDLAFRAGQFERAVELGESWLTRTNVAADQAAEVRLKVALSLLKLDRRDESLKALGALIETRPPAALGAQAHYWRGVLLAAESSADGRAIEALRQAVAGPLPEEQKAAAMTLIAQQHVKAGRQSDALEAYEQLRGLRSPEKFEPTVAVWVGRGLHQAGRDEAALLWLRPLVARRDVSEPIKAEALFHIGESLRRLGRHEEAIETYRQLVALSRGYEDQGRLGLAHALQAVGKPTEAINEYDALISASASEVAADSLLHSALLRLGPMATSQGRQEARKRLNRIVILYDVPQLTFLVDRALMTLGDMDVADDRKDAARRQFAAVADRNPPSPWRDAAAAELAILDGNLGGAATLLRKMYHDSADPLLKVRAEQRLMAIGERP